MELDRVYTYEKEPNKVMINCGNDYYDKYFILLCEWLEKGYIVSPYIDCIGHSRNNRSQESYKQALENKYGERLETIFHEGVCSYSYSYKLKEEI